MSHGYIKLFRQIQECDFLWDSADEPFDKRSAWIDLLLMANHKDKRIMFNGKAITVKAGQRITSMRGLAVRWHWSRNKVKRYLDLLEGEGMLTKECDSKKTLVTIVNYGKFQGEAGQDEPPMEPQMKPQTEPQKGHRRSTNKNDKNDKNEKNTYGEFHHVRLTDQELERLKSDLGESMTDECIKFLDEYMEEKPKYKSESHNLAIRRWIVDAVKEKQAKAKPEKPKGNFNQMITNDNQYTDIIKQLEGR